MIFRPVSNIRVHVLYTAPLILGFVSIILTVSSLCGLVPWGQTTGTALVIHRNSPDPNDKNTASFHFGLLGSCYRLASGHKLHCTPAAFPPDYNTTLSQGGKGINVQHLEISMPDLPPVFISWLLISIVALVCQFLGALPVFAPEKLSQRRFQSKYFFSAALWILGMGWAVGFSAVLALACFVKGFAEDYNKFSGDFLYNKASCGPIFAPLGFAMVAQVVIIVAIIIQIANAPDKDGEGYSSSWVEQFRVTGP